MVVTNGLYAYVHCMCADFQGSSTKLESLYSGSLVHGSYVHKYTYLDTCRCLMPALGKSQHLALMRMNSMGK